MIADLSLVLAALIGLVIGSFLNVAIIRYNTGKGLKGRSQCLSCGRQLEWAELIPVLSFLWQKGRCRGCSSRISAQYVLVEIITALIFAAVAFTALQLAGPGDWWAALRFWLWGSAVASILIVIAGYDLRHKIIPDQLVYAFMVMAALGIFFIDLNSGFSQVVWLLHGIYSGGLLFIPFWLLWHFSEGRLMGFGDAKLVFGLGLWLGLKMSLVALLIAFISGAVIGLLLIYCKKSPLVPKALRNLSLKSEIPFAPFLVFGAIISFIFLAHGTPLSF